MTAPDPPPDPLPDLGRFAGDRAVLLMNHRWTDLAERKFERLSREIGDRAQVLRFIQYPADRPALPHALHRHDEATLLFEPRRLEASLGYPFCYDRRMFPGSGHYPLLALFRQTPLTHALVLEYDLEFTGDWGALVDLVARADPDLATCHLGRFADCPDWPWWPPLAEDPAERLRLAAQSGLLRSFNPLIGLSRRAAGWIDAGHATRWRWHHEMSAPTLVARHGGRILDLAAHCRLADGDRFDPSETSDPARLSTMRWHPPVTREEFKARNARALLFHPLKHDWCWDGARVTTADDSHDRRAELLAGK